MSVNYKWRKAFSIPKIGFSIEDRERENFPELIDCWRIARMQHPTDLHAERVLAYTLIDVCKSDALPHTAETTNKMTSPAKTVDTHRRVTLFSGPAREVYTVPAKYKDVTTYLLTAPAFAAWLAAQGEVKSDHIAAWFEAMAVAADAPPASAPLKAPGANSKKREPRASWSDKLDYIAEIASTTKRTRARGLWDELKLKAGKEGSPFVVGTGIDRDKLVVKDNGAPLAFHTLETNMKIIRMKAAEIAAQQK